MKLVQHIITESWTGTKQARWINNSGQHDAVQHLHLYTAPRAHDSYCKFWL